jgi:uncharacterized protein involved in response to NO
MTGPLPPVGTHKPASRMTEQTDGGPGYHGPAFFSYGFRPFFLGAAIFAGVAVPAWIVILIRAGDSALFHTGRQWHTHEMIFGFLSAVVTGFLLTAIPNWTDRPPIRGRTLVSLFALWLAGRLIMAVPFMPLLPAVIDGAFLVAVAGLVWREIVAARTWSSTPIGVLIGLYAGANMLFHVLVIAGTETEPAERMALGLFMMLLALIGGRITPNFTREHLREHRLAGEPPGFSRFDGVSIILVGIAAVAWIVGPEHKVTGWMLITAGLAHVGRMARWYGWMTWREPLVLILHLGYGWLALSLLLLGASIVGAGLQPADALHALTTGSVGAMTLAVMTRASLGHTGRPRHAGPMTVGIYTLVNVGAALRVFGPSTDLPIHAILGLAAVCWSGAYLLFAAVYGPFLLRASLDD